MLTYQARVFHRVKNAGGRIKNHSRGRRARPERVRHARNKKGGSYGIVDKGAERDPGCSAEGELSVAGGGGRYAPDLQRVWL